MKENNINKQIPSKEERFQQEQVELLKSCGNGYERENNKEEETN